MKIILDRIEFNSKNEKIAVFEYGEETLTVHESDLPTDFANSIKSGDIIECTIENGVIHSPVILTEETENKQVEMQERLNKLFNRNKNR